MAASWRSRTQWLGRWWFLAAVAALALNDHVFKAQFGNWWTGKLSDVVGPVVVATLIAVPLGRTVGIAATTVGFVALKTVPGVAELAAPILGGTTLRDATDLIGLAALIPLWGLMADPPPVATDAAPMTTRAAMPVTSQSKRRVRRTVQALGLLAAVMATTATSDDDPPSVAGLERVDDALYVSVRNDRYDESYESWRVSTDGGMTWESASSPRLDDDPRYQVEDCRGDGTCFRSAGTRIEARTADHEWRTVYSLTWDQRRLLAHRSGNEEPRYGPPHVVPVAGGEHVVFSAGEEGVLVLDADNRWHRRAVGSAGPTDLSGTYVFFWLGTWMIPAAALVALIWVPIRAAQPSKLTGGARWLVGISAVLISAAMWAITVFSWWASSWDRDDPVDAGILLMVLSILVVAAPLGFIRLLGGAVRKGPHCISDPLPPPPGTSPPTPAPPR